jgi:GGDEF domain-containing protein
MVRMLASIIGVGVETADMLVQEILSRNLRDRRAVTRYAGATFFVVWEAGNANDELNSYANQIIDIRNEAAKTTNQARLTAMTIGLDNIRNRLSYLPSNHRIAFWFTNIESRTSDVINDAVSVERSINRSSPMR